MDAGRRAGSRQLCMLACALSRSDRHVLALLLCAGLMGFVLCCDVLAVDAINTRPHARTYKRKQHEKEHNNMKNRRIKRKDSPEGIERVRSRSA